MQLHAAVSVLLLCDLAAASSDVSRNQSLPSSSGLQLVGQLVSDLASLFSWSGSTPRQQRREASPVAQTQNIVSKLIRAISTEGTFNRLSQQSWTSMWNNQTSNLVTRDDPVQSKCYSGLGCVNYSQIWYHSMYRPVNHFPLERHVIAVKFLVHTRSRRHGNTTVATGDGDSLRRAGLDCSKHTKFIVHGFLDTGEDDWVHEMTERLLDVGDFNVIAVDWRMGALPLYQQAVANTRLVAMETVAFIKWLQEDHGLDLSRVHLIGHSLGAHTAGYVGAGLAGLGRITGLDPAQPGFQYLDPQLHLDHTDAKFVDVIHTDGRNFLAGGFGMIEPCGHLDFYPNGGLQQPGCGSYTEALTHVADSSIDDIEAELFACRHVRAIRFFTDSIAQQRSCSFLAHRCNSYDDFLQGLCSDCGESGSNCAAMGYYADQSTISGETNVQLYTTTAPFRPYCLHHYQLLVHMDDSEDTAPEVSGRLVATLYGTKNTLDHYLMPQDGPITLERGGQYSFLVRTPLDLGEIQRLQLLWRGTRVLPCLLWCPDQGVRVRDVLLQDMNYPRSETLSEVRMCPSNKNARLEPGGKGIVFYGRAACGKSRQLRPLQGFNSYVR